MIKLKVCCGTSCYIMGSSELISMEFDESDQIEMEGTTCMNLCKDSEKRPPYVTVNGVLHSQVTPTKLLSIIEDIKNAI